MQLEGQGMYRDAAVLEEQAVGVDSLFTLAISELSYIHRKLGNDSVALYYHRRVLPLISRVTDKERFYILSVYYGPSFELDFSKAYESNQQLVVRYPNDAEGFAQLGWLAMYDGNVRAAIEAFQRALSLDSMPYYSGQIYSNWGYTLALAGDGKNAIDFFRRSKLIRPTYYSNDRYIAEAHWLNGELDSAEQTLRTMLPVAGAQERILAHMHLAPLYEFQGKLRAARAECTDAITACRRENRSSDEAYFHYLLGELAAESSQWDAYMDEMKQAQRLSRSPYFELPLIGASFARNGRLRASRRIVSDIGSAKSADPYFLKRRKDYVHLVNGEIMLQNRSPLEATDEFRSVERLHSGDPIFLLAQWGIARAAGLHGDTNAITLYRNLLQRRGEAVMAFVRSIRTSGFWTRQLWPDADFELGKFFLRTNDSALAEQHLRRCLEYWSHADADDQRALDAANILAQLTKSR
jgi:tetratricopeptide (TPR) repeat protein